MSIKLRLSFRRHASAALLAATALLPAHGTQAATSNWAQNDGGRMRIIALPATADGTVQGALQIEPTRGWITYWKEPGQAGIPPQVVVSPGNGITLEKMDFPVPSLFDAGGIKDLGYDHAVTLPFTLKVADPSAPLKIHASAFIGLCRNICIPFQADFEVDLTRANGLPLEENLILDEARRKLPEKPSDDFSVTHYMVANGREKLSLALRLPEGVEKPQIFVATPGGRVLFDQASPRRIEGLYVVDMPFGKHPPGESATTDKHWDILVIAGNRAMETKLAFD
ncbi:protein-disulfide reductase DsbD domain-containing protein [Rhizobium straminoryzae]|uniref:Cytochrome C biogenesis protein n=1 Tax=Rhizobium straminoryzae TaxID=1387186 RepID=A0A549TC17_9HYPH|nr:protein-disulfide reductase DsbD domain-containing protein [Rhizobium straminoryzae]TRL39394.1 cytochrome C biogenesis protein [Rhizobium straminoryzae]